MTDLEQKIVYAAQKYYTDGSSPYSDEEFDSFIDELRSTQPQSELLRTGWGYDVFSDTTPGSKVKHKYGHAGSLDKCHNLREIRRSLIGETIDASLKLDGLSCVMYFKYGYMTQALTRGDGELGIDITEKIRTILKIDASYRFPAYSNFTGAVRGEILMSLANFEEFVKIHPEAKNPRNSTAGIINGKDTDDDLKFLDVIVYTVVGCETEDLKSEIKSVWFIRNMLKDMFGPDKVVPYVPIIIDNSGSDQALLQQMEWLRERWYGNYPADGIVLTAMNTVIAGEEVLYDSQAFKFKSESKSSTVVDIIWTLSKTRYLIPKIQIEPVQLAGTTVQYATAYHAQYVKESGLGPRAVVTITKSGEIIPKVLDVLQKVEYELPTTCPECGSTLIQNGVHLQCPDETCGNAVIQDTLVWLNSLVPTDGLGDTLKEKFLQQLVDADVISNVSIEEIMNSSILLNRESPSAQERLFAEMWYNLHNSTFKLSSALIALNIPRVSSITSIKFAEHSSIVKEILEFSKESGHTSLPYVLFRKLEDSIGHANAASVDANLKKFKRLSFIEDKIVWETKKIESRGKVAITGKLSVPRSKLEDELRSVGFTPGDVSKDTKYLIIDDLNSSSSKNQKAIKFGVTRMSEQEFRSRFL